MPKRVLLNRYHLFLFCYRIFPKYAMLEAGKCFGADKCMDTFVGRHELFLIPVHSLTFDDTMSYNFLYNK